MNTKHLEATHGVVCRLPGERFGYFGWPAVARLAVGLTAQPTEGSTLLVVSSGLRCSVTTRITH